VSNPKGFDVQFVDFDGVQFHLSTTPEDKAVVLLSMGVRCWPELAKFGAQEIIQREYSNWLSPSVEPDYNISLLFDLRRVPRSLGELKR
jgi:actin related protein 2/3 complex subunit 2